jgi:formylmethanofuran dehydrogenase subunit E
MMMAVNSLDFPEDFRECARFHGHVCPGLAVGYAAVKAGSRLLELSAAQDEEIVAFVENDSCAVDAVQVLLGCTFGKGNLIFRDWGKQVFTFLDRAAGRAARVSFKGRLPHSEERHALKKKIDAGEASDAEKQLWDKLRKQAVVELISADPTKYFEIREIQMGMPPHAQIVVTRPCDICGEATVISRLIEREKSLICRDCAQKGNIS